LAAVGSGGAHRFILPPTIPGGNGQRGEEARLRVKKPGFLEKPGFWARALRVRLKNSCAIGGNR
jgi:hypothetical protein